MSRSRSCRSGSPPHSIPRSAILRVNPTADGIAIGSAVTVQTSDGPVQGTVIEIMSDYIKVETADGLQLWYSRERE